LAKEVKELWGAGHPRAVLGPQLTPGGSKPGGRPIQHVHHPGAEHHPGGGVLAGNPNGQIRATVAVEVAGGQRVAKAIAGLGDAADSRAVLGPQLLPAAVSPPVDP
jgi:hypothetical protein